ncbi:hypothetical protein B0T18DRAFT_485895 [Schizothecium vesticola]|uniref:Uncharacterized protein n=1 Tax=Schizothecium vesticola TaxID=314040 RepID=A0AA40F515_9PEZI|nr:hypothetical protein B0T18DRAFT_485895 [Schizothecium vesticola]
MTEPPAFPTAQELVAAWKFYGGSTAFMRLRWSIRAPVSSAIFVIDSAIDYTSPQQPYYSPSHPGGVHPIASEPATHPPVSSMRLTVMELDRWADNWDMAHGEHEPLFCSQEFDEDNLLVRCCGQGRPGPGPHLDIPASTQPFIMVNDIIEAVHPWLLGLEDKIRMARGLPDGPLKKGFEIYVSPVGSVALGIVDTRIYSPSNLERWWKDMAALAAYKLEMKAAAAGKGLTRAGEEKPGARLGGLIRCYAMQQDL